MSSLNEDSAGLKVNKKFLKGMLRKTHKDRKADKLCQLRDKIKEKYRRLTPAPRIPHYEDEPDWRYKDPLKKKLSSRMKKKSDFGYRKRHKSSPNRTSRRRMIESPLHDMLDPDDVSHDVELVDIPKRNKLIVFNIGNATKEVLNDVFSPCGEIEDIIIITDRETSLPRGFGFVEFVSDTSAETAYRVCDGLTVDGKIINVQYADEDEHHDDHSKRIKNTGVHTRISVPPRPIQIFNRGGKKLLQSPEKKKEIARPLALMRGIPHIKKSFVSSKEKLMENAKKSDDAVAFCIPDICVVTSQLEKELQSYYSEIKDNAGEKGSLLAKEVASITKDFPITEGPKEGPLTEEEELKKKKEAEHNNAVTSLYHYWDVVKETPHDFEGWTVLLNHAESMDMEDHLVSAFEGFLPYFPYCYAYWEKYSEIEHKFKNIERCLGVLLLGTECVPMSEHLWITLFEKFLKYSHEYMIPVATIRNLYEYGLSTIGIAWRSSKFWEACIDFEVSIGNFPGAFQLYKRLLHIPLKLSNRHFDCLKEFLREHDPRYIMPNEEYQKLRSEACNFLDLLYHPGAFMCLASYKGEHPESMIAHFIRKKLSDEFHILHEKNIASVEKRWTFEERVQRPFYHVRPIERRELNNWIKYLDFEIKEGDPVRIVSLFEFCLVGCAPYAELWIKYATYFENYVLECLKKKKSASETDKDNVEKQLSEGDENQANEEEGVQQLGVKEALDQVAKKVKISQTFMRGLFKPDPNFVPHSLPQHDEPGLTIDQLKYQMCLGIPVGNFVLKCPPLTRDWIENYVSYEDVRHIFRRAVWVHCPNHPILIVQWAEFELNQGDFKTCKELLKLALEKTPGHLKARMMLIELELKEENHGMAEELFMKGFRALTNSSDLAWLATRFSRFMFKNKQDTEKSLAFLRKAMKKYKSYPYLYHLLFDICYEQCPVDNDGALATLQLALASKDLSNEHKVWFALKKFAFLSEHGDTAEMKIARYEYIKLKKIVDEELHKKVKKEAKEKTKKECADKIRHLQINAYKSWKNHPQFKDIHPDRFQEAMSLVEYFYPRAYYIQQQQKAQEEQMRKQQEETVRKGEHKDKLDHRGSRHMEEEFNKYLKNKQQNTLCKDGTYCRVRHCPFVHRQRCRYGWGCKKARCFFWHGEDNMVKDRLDDRNQKQQPNTYEELLEEYVKKNKEINEHRRDNSRETRANSRERRDRRRSYEYDDQHSQGNNRRNDRSDFKERFKNRLSYEPPNDRYRRHDRNRYDQQDRQRNQSRYENNPRIENNSRHENENIKEGTVLPGKESKMGVVDSVQNNQPNNQYQNYIPNPEQINIINQLINNSFGGSKMNPMPMMQQMPNQFNQMPNQFNQMPNQMMLNPHEGSYSNIENMPEHMQENLLRGGPEMDSSFNVEFRQPTREIHYQKDYCVDCKKNFKDKKSYVKHLDKEPLHRLEVLLSIEASRPNSTHTLDDLKNDLLIIRTMTDPTDSITCFICGMILNTLEVYKSHIIGKKHTKALNNLVNNHRVRFMKGKICTICQIDFNVNFSSEQYFQHMRSPYHEVNRKAKMEKLNKPPDVSSQSNQDDSQTQDNNMNEEEPMDHSRSHEHPYDSPQNCPVSMNDQPTGNVFPITTSQANSYSLNHDAIHMNQSGPESNTGHPFSGNVMDNSNSGPGFLEDSNMGNRYQDDSIMGPKFPDDSNNMGSRDPDDSNITSRFPDDSNVGPRNPDNSNMGPRFPDNSNMGPRFADNSNMGPRFADNSNMGPRFPDNNNTGPRFPDNTNTGPRFPDNTNTGPRFPGNSNMGPRFAENSNMGPRFTDNSNVGPRFSDDSNMGPRFVDNSNMGPRFPDNSNMGPRFPDNSNMGPRFPNNSNMGPRFPDNNSNMGPRFPDNSNMGPRFPNNDPNMGPRFPDNSNMGPRFPNNDPNMGPRFPDNSNMGPRFPNNDPNMGPRFPDNSNMGSRFCDNSNIGSSFPNDSNSGPRFPDNSNMHPRFSGNFNQMQRFPNPNNNRPQLPLHATAATFTRPRFPQSSQHSSRTDINKHSKDNNQEYQREENQQVGNSQEVRKGQQRELYLFHDGPLKNMKIEHKNFTVTISDIGGISLNEIGSLVTSVVGQVKNAFIIIHAGTSEIEECSVTELKDKFLECATAIQSALINPNIWFMLMLPLKNKGKDTDIKRLKFNVALKTCEFTDKFKTIKNGEFEIPSEKIYNDDNFILTEFANKEIASLIKQSIVKML